MGAPPGRGTRPTADRTREGLFSTVESLVPLAGARVLDLYAGSGAVGLEAASRGAAGVTLVERDRAALTTLRRNVAELGLAGVRVVAAPVERYVGVPLADEPPYDLVFADPPYELAADRLAAVLTDLAAGGWLADGAIAVVERAARDADWVWPDPLVAERRRAYGEGVLWYGRRP